MGERKGFSLVELVVVLGILFMLLTVATPQWQRVYQRVALRQAGFRLLTDAQRCQALAAQHLAKVGLVFDVDGGGSFYVLVMDGNGNGVSRKDYLTGRDKVVGGPVYFRDFGPQVRLGLPPKWHIPAPSGNKAVPGEGTALGKAGILSFSPSFGATPGSVYLSAGTEVLALRVTPMGVARLFTWDTQRRLWQAVKY